MMAMNRIVFALAVIAACGGDDEPPLSDATSLLCPTPGLLPFRTESRGFVRSENKTLATEDPRSKDEASDTLGNPGGVVASTYLEDAAAAAADPIGYRGAKARTTPTGGLFNNPLPGEHVSLWFHDDAAAEWQQIGRADTGDDGYYEIADSGFVAPNNAPVYSVLEADGSCAEHYDFLLPPGSKVIVTDIDGTLTLDDTQLIMEIADENYVPVQMGAADRLTQAWAAKHYPIVYLTARTHLLRNETRVWLRDLGFPPGPVITSDGANGPDIYKTAWMNRIIDDFGWTPVAVYGNADTDITAYENAGVAKNLTFIVGDLAGTRSTVAIPNNDFSEHITTFVNAQPDNN